ncbi:putative AAA-ATPase [Clostridiales bacterium CHKCI001]|nr:putative AAA-ATPase [Clostridiales bacterium CHKCI001]
MFIAELLNNWGKVNLFTRPRRFGKSLNMSMLKCFFEINCEKALFDGADILQEKELCEQYMGQFPVISISLKGVDGLNYQQAYAALRRLIGNEALRFYCLSDSPELLPDEKKTYQALIHVKDGRFTMDDEMLIDSLRTLSQLLSKHYGQKVILLIDEYDVPLNKAFQTGYYDEMIVLIRNLFSNALKTNDFLQFAVLTGCLRVSKESIFTGLNNLKVHTITDARYDKYFGFTEKEVNGMLAFYGLESYQDIIRDWYEGYRFGKVSLYCPWDVLNYCDELLADEEAEPENYWANTSENDMIRRFIDKADKNTKNEIEQLVNGGTIVKSIKQELTYKDMDDSIENVWSILLATGYLTQRGRSFNRQFQLAIPNKEVKELFIDLVKDWFKETTRADWSRIEKFCMAFPKGDVTRIGEMLHDYLWDSISVRDTAVRKNRKENFYHGMLLGLLQSQGNWLIQSNAELGEGYSDISICTSEKIGIVIELKYAEDANLKKGCEETLKQIEEKKYAVGLKRKGMKNIIKYGIAFCEKECMVVMA